MLLCVSMQKKIWLQILEKMSKKFCLESDFLSYMTRAIGVLPGGKKDDAEKSINSQFGWLEMSKLHWWVSRELLILKGLRENFPEFGQGFPLDSQNSGRFSPFCRSWKSWDMEIWESEIMKCHRDYGIYLQN